jgi:hypothetical protein
MSNERPITGIAMLVHRGAAAPKPPTNRSALTNDPRTFAGLKLTSPRGRRFRDLLNAFLNRMGNPSDPIRQADAIAAASAMVIAEDTRARALRGEGVDLDALVRLENTAHRATRKLGIKPSAGPKVPTLAEHLAAKRAAEAAGGHSE